MVYPEDLKTKLDELKHEIDQCAEEVLENVDRIAKLGQSLIDLEQKINSESEGITEGKIEHFVSYIFLATNEIERLLGRKID